MKDLGAQHRRLGKPVEEFGETREIVSIDGIRVIIKARHDWRDRFGHQAIPSSAGADSLRTEDHARLWACRSDRVGGGRLPRVDMDEYFNRRRDACEQSLYRLNNRGRTVERRHNSGDGGF